jgi:hypothetical protein
MASSEWSRGLISKPHAIIDAMRKRLMSCGFPSAHRFARRVERQTVPRASRQVLPSRHAIAEAKRIALARQSLPPRQIFPGISCRRALRDHAQKAAIYLAF